MSFRVTAKPPETSAADWTTLVEDSVSIYVADNCEKGILIRAYDGCSTVVPSASMWLYDLPANMLRKEIDFI